MIFSIPIADATNARVHQYHSIVYLNERVLEGNLYRHTPILINKEEHHRKDTLKSISKLG